MEVSVVEQAEIARKLTITLGAELFDKAVKSQLTRYAKTAKIPGFRKGKIPQKMLEQHFGGSAIKDAVDGLINEYYLKALQQEKLVPASLLSITPSQVERGKDFVFEVEIEIYPKIDAPDLKGDTIKQYDISVTPADIDRTLVNIQQRQTHYHTKDKKATKGDQLIIDFIGKIDGEAFTGGQANDTELVLGQGQFMPEFETNLTGSKKGDEKVFTLDFPADYHGTEVAGKTAEFSVTVKQVNEGHVPKLDDDFAKSMGIDGGMDEMRTEVEAGLEREMQQKLRDNTRSQVMSTLVKKHNFPIPKDLVEEEIDRAIKEITNQMQQQGMPTTEAIKRETYEAASKERVKLGLLMRAVIETEKLESTNELIEERIREMASGYSDPEQYSQYVLNNEQQRNQIASVILEEQVVMHLLDTAKINKIEKSYEEFMTSE